MEFTRKLGLHLICCQDVYENVSFDRTKKVAVIFDDRSLFSEIFTRACDELHCN
jgi:hypothetical protein